MKLTYIYHSCFAIESEDFTILIDFFKDTEGDFNSGYVNQQLLTRNNRLYVLSSHSHHDHFSKKILKWRETRLDIIYILSKDILLCHKAKADDAYFIDKFEIFEDDLLKITAFGSTDIGVSLLIEIDGKRIFHAGDLNNWHWKEESTPEEVESAEHYFLSELCDISTRISHLDVAMFPIDKRLGKDYMRGAEQFLSAIKTDLFAPMHFGKYFESAAAIKPFAESKGGKIVEWTKKGESVEI
ncbi:MAG: MBL fold metallo-hydrolase [Bacteroidales bacterium]|nr:MBL fold metallo-hydrolase [Bacteroidales bacterium]